MPAYGPVPKRSDERIRRNKVEGLEKVEVLGLVKQPLLIIENPHPIVKKLYAALKTSAQAQYYEPAEWYIIQVILDKLNTEILKGTGSNGQLFMGLISELNDAHLISEGARRRHRLEITRNDTQDAKVLKIEDYLDKVLMGG